MNKLCSILLLITQCLFISACDSNSNKIASNSSPKKTFLTILPVKFKQKLDTNEFVLIDVRAKNEHDKSRIAGSILIDYHSKDFYYKLNRLDKKQKYLIHCHKGARSSITLKLMKKLGFSQVYELKGGITSWKDSGYKIIWGGA